VYVNACCQTTGYNRLQPMWAPLDIHALALKGDHPLRPGPPIFSIGFMLGWWSIF